MTRITEREARVRVYTFKEGLLSAVAHDLEIEVGRFFVEWPPDATQLVAELDARSLRVLHALAGGAPNPQALSARDRKKIDDTIAGEILHAERHPTIRFEARVGALEPLPRFEQATLTLGGRRVEVKPVVTRDGEDLLARLTLHQPDFGISPYSAMFGTLKIRPDVVVEARIPAALVRSS